MEQGGKAQWCRGGDGADIAGRGLWQQQQQEQQRFKWGSTGTGGTTGATTGATTGSSGSSNYPAIPAGPIKIGIDTSLSGPLAAYGVSGAANYKALVNLVNKNGGVDGHPIDLTIENDQGSTTDLGDGRPEADQ